MMPCRFSKADIRAATLASVTAVKASKNKTPHGLAGYLPVGEA
jgi:hypothetical protein